MQNYLGIDLGGTNIKTALVTAQGRVLAARSRPTGDDLSARAVIANIVAAAHETLGNRPVQAVGIISPGQADFRTGVVKRAANFPSWRNVPLTREVTRAIGAPAFLENDANAAAFGEYFAGAGKKKNVETLIMITLGTGVGGGIVINGQLLHGKNAFAAEVGHMLLVPDGRACPCGQRGCVEAYCSANAIGARATEMLATGVDSTLRKLEKITSADVLAAATRGDALAKRVWDDACRDIAITCLNVARVFDPEVIVLGGGLTQAGAKLLGPVQGHLKKLWWKVTAPPSAKAPLVRLATLGNNAGAIGAAGVAMGRSGAHR